MRGDGCEEGGCEAEHWVVGKRNDQGNTTCGASFQPGLIQLFPLNANVQIFSVFLHLRQML